MSSDIDPAIALLLKPDGLEAFAERARLADANWDMSACRILSSACLYARPTYPDWVPDKAVIRKNFGKRFKSFEDIVLEAAASIKKGKGPWNPRALDYLPEFVNYERSRGYKTPLWELFSDYHMGRFLSFCRSRIMPDGYFDETTSTTLSLPAPLLRIKDWHSPLLSKAERDASTEQLKPFARGTDHFCSACLRRLCYACTTSGPAFIRWYGYVWVYVVHHRSCEDYIQRVFNDYREKAEQLKAQVGKVQQDTRLQIRRMNRWPEKLLQSQNRSAAV